MSRTGLTYAVGIGILFLLIISSTVNMDTQKESMQSNTAENQQIVLSDYTAHAPFVITSDSDFAAQGWPGNGSVTNPYIIEGLQIGGEIGITINNTRANFTIRECLLESSDTGIYMFNVTHGVITDSEFTNGYQGIYEWNCTRIIFSNNSFHDQVRGIRMIGGHAITIAHTIFTHVIVGTDINDVDDSDITHHTSGKLENITITNCQIYDSFSGFKVQSNHLADHCIIQSCYINNARRGISVEFMSDVSIINNTIRNTERGIHTLFSVPAKIIDNTLVNSSFDIDPDISGWLGTVQGNTVNGKKLGYFNYIQDVTIDGTEYGQIYLSYCHDITINGGSFENQVIGIFIDHSTDCTISDVTIKGATRFGIYLSAAIHCVVSDSEFVHSYIAIQASFCKNVQVVNNFMHNQSVGISIDNDSNSTCINNKIIESFYTSILLQHVTKTMIVNNTIDNTVMTGIKASYSSEISLINNKVSFCEQGIVLSESETSVITQNTIMHNNLTGLQLLRCEQFNITYNTIANNSVGIELQSFTKTCLVYGNTISLNRKQNAYDYGMDNTWDNGIDVGNAWGDYSGNGTYPIQGTAGSVDRYPTFSDIDQDGLFDKDEIQTYGTDPYNPDTDGDGVSDGDEINMWRNPLDPYDQGPIGILVIGGVIAVIILLFMIKRRK
ncbi:MAG: right-handed parallel beta-helix repeat-containing protein [Candidatus Thorarchaeota archaeon]|nr:right-handed parallel beta-helix repeat-containing protein [Candidatus Thorarchaeota archaeon]